MIFTNLFNLSDGVTKFLKINIREKNKLKDNLILM